MLKYSFWHSFLSIEKTRHYAWLFLLGNVFNYNKMNSYLKRQIIVARFGKFASVAVFFVFVFRCIDADQFA